MEQPRVGDESYGFHKLDAGAVRLPYTLRILLENVLRHGSDEGADAVAGWVADAEPSREISFHPARVLLQDFTGVPAVVDVRDGVAFPDTLVGTDSHTTMVNGLGVLGWGVGGIEAEAAMLGEALSMLVPQVVGFRLTGALREGATATDLVLTVTEILRRTGVVGKFVEYFGHGLESLPLADRATLGNMPPEYGATCGFFPVDGETIA